VSSIGIVEITSETPTVAGVMSARDVACVFREGSGPQSRAVVQTRQHAGRHREMHWSPNLRAPAMRAASSSSSSPSSHRDQIAYEKEQFELMLRLRDESGRPGRARRIHTGCRALQRDAVDRPMGGRQALDQLVHRSGIGIKPYTIAVNLSGTILNDERFLEYLIAELSARDLPAGAMCF